MNINSAQTYNRTSSAESGQQGQEMLPLQNRGLFNLTIPSSEVRSVLALLTITFRDVNFSKLHQPLTPEQIDKLPDLQRCLSPSLTPAKKDELAAIFENLRYQHFSLTQELYADDQGLLDGAPGATDSDAGSRDGSSQNFGETAPTRDTRVAFEVAAGGARVDATETTTATLPTPGSDMPNADRPVGFTGALGALRRGLVSWGPATLGAATIGAVALPVIKSITSAIDESKKPVHDNVALAARVLLPVGVVGAAAAVIWQRIQFEGVKRALNARLDASDRQLSQMEAGLRRTNEGGQGAERQ